MKCHACWKAARKSAIETHRSPSTIYKHMETLRECPHHGKPAKKAHRPELALSITVGPLTPLSIIFPERAAQ